MANRSLQLDKSNGKLLGVCAGIADFTGIDATWVRVGFVLGTLLGAGILIPVYVIIALVAKDRSAF